MKLIFTKSNLPLSVLIRWGLSEPVSHFAMVFEDKVIFQSNLLGTQINWLKTFLSKHGSEIVFTLEYPLEEHEEDKVWDAICDENDGKSYDYGAFLYFMYRAFLLKFFKLPLPKKNVLATKGEFLCTKLSQSLPADIIPGVAEIQDADIVTPYQLYLVLQKAQAPAPKNP